MVKYFKCNLREMDMEIDAGNYQRDMEMYKEQGGVTCNQNCRCVSP